MGVLIKKQKGLPVLTGMAKLSIIIFLISLSSSVVDTVWAVYLYSFFKSESAVGYFSSFLTLVALGSYIIFVPLIENSRKMKVFAYSLLGFAITYTLFALNRNLYILVILAFILTMLYTFRITSLGIIIKNKSQQTQLSRNEGMRYTFMNIAWVIGPLISGYIADKYEINLVFVLSAIFIFLALILFRTSHIRDNEKIKKVKKQRHRDILKNFFQFFRNRERLVVYFIGGGAALWWGFIYLYMPIHIIKAGLSNLWVGYFLFAVAIPLILCEYAFSKWAEKIGFRTIFKIGFILTSILAFSSFFIESIYVIMALLVLASFGMAMIEPTSEAYFFDLIDDRQECRFYGPYNTTIDVNHFIGKMLAASMLLFLPFKYLFILFGVLMFLMFLLSFKVKNIIEKNKRKTKNSRTLRLKEELDAKDGE